MQRSLKVAISDDFLRCFAAIPQAKQKSVMKFITRFRENPASTGINYEKINNAADANMRSVRIDQDYRGIVLKPDRGDVYCLLWVAKHDDAYDWAQRHKAAIHPDAGNIQVFESIHFAGTVDAHVAPERVSLFDSLKDRELTRLGVPEDALPLVRAVDSENALDALQSQLPVDAWEYLYFYSSGESYESLIADRELPARVDTTDFAAALELDSTKRKFVVITEDSDLQALLSAPLAVWRVFLHPSQRKLVERDWNGSVRVLGGAGTGKTVAALHRAVWLARHRYAGAEGKPILFVTFTRTLAEDIRSHIAAIASPAEQALIDVVNVDQWAVGILKRFGYRPRVVFEERERRNAWMRAFTRKPEGRDYPNSFYQAEFERVVLAQRCETLEDYLKVSRVGRGVQLTRAQRQLIWQVFAEYRSQLSAMNLREPEEAYRDALAILKKEGASLGIRSMIVDETQDLSAAALALLRAAVPVGQNDMFLVGDAHQRIYRHRVTLSKVGIDIRGRGRRLRINYRTTDEIRKWATAKLENCSIDDLDGQADSLRGYKSLSRGPAPEDQPIASREAERAAILDALARLHNEEVLDSGVCLVVRTNAEADEYADWLTRSGRTVRKLDRDTPDDQNLPGIRVATMHRVKGLEFEAVIIAGYRGPERLAKSHSDDDDAGVFVDAVTTERSLLHVAATRAKRFLMVRRLSVA
jgi:superfamily I DNA/RNA helicase